MSTIATACALPTKTTLWFWPSGLYPRRIAYYLKAKQLPSSVLENLTIVPTFLNTEVGALQQVPDAEPRPQGTSLPALRIGDKHIIRQSSSILTYFEEMYGPTLSGRDPIHRARVADIVQLVNEALVWTNVYLRHTHEMSLMWSGMTKVQQSKSSGEDALEQWHAAMAKLETWVEDDVVEKQATSIAGGNEPTLADFTLMTARPYLFTSYGWDVFDGYEVLKLWHDRAVKSEWYLDEEELAQIDQGDFVSLFKG